MQTDNGDSFELRESEEHFAHLVAGVQDYAIFLLDPRGRIRSWNQGANRLKGYTASEVIGRSFEIFYPPEAVAVGWPQEELRRAAADVRFEDEGWRIRKDGTRMWANIVITALRSENGELRGYLKITRDLTERKQAEEIVRQSEERFRLLVEGVQDYGIFMLDPEAKVSSWNIGAQRINGYSAEEIIGRHFSAFYPQEDIAAGKPEREIEIAKREGRYEEEGWRLRKDGSLFWANVVITALYNKERQLRGFAKVTRDLTERRQVRELEIADRQKNEFLAMLAHELRNPLAPISNAIEVLQMSRPDDSTVIESAQVMNRQLGHMIRLIDDLLDVSRITTGKISLHREPSELNSIITRSIEEVQPLLDAKGHELMISLPSRPIVVDADPIRLAQVFSNLLINAVKYTPTASQISLSAERSGNQVLIRVRDSGIGIAPEFLPKVFGLFVQADHSLERKQGGLGIGLNLVKRIVALHEGEVTAASPGLGKGSEFIVRLPIAIGARPLSPPNRPRPARQAPQRKILVIDDNVDAAVTLAKLLTLWGHEVQVVFNGSAALDAAERIVPDIILLDIGLPGMSGYEVAKQLRQSPSLNRLLIIALTGYGQTEDREEAARAGFDLHIVKPPDADFLEAITLAPHAYLGRLSLQSSAHGGALET